jgi:hypothetical protein
MYYWRETRGSLSLDEISIICRAHAEAYTLVVHLFFHYVHVSCRIGVMTATYCIGRSSIMRPHVLSVRDDLDRECVDDEFVGMIDISRSRC